MARVRQEIVIDGRRLPAGARRRRWIYRESGVSLPPEHWRAERRRATRRRVRRRRAGALALVLTAVLALVVAIASGAHPRHSGPASPAAGPPPRFAHPGLAAREAAAIRGLEQRMAFVSVAGDRRREIALTFDDGPGPYTLRLARTLRRLHTSATFFQVGVMAQTFTDAQRYLVAHRSFVLADHTRTHARMAGMAPGLQDQQVADTAALQRLAGAPGPTLFRPPYGVFDASTLNALRRHDMLMVLWSLDARDYLRPGVPAIVSRVLEGARPGAIVLLHDGGGDRSQTLAALPAIVHRLRRRHYHLVTVPRLLADDPPPLAQSRPPPGVG
jgi:peptidoglycan-N-acetylglucosamine deacetylase